MKNEQLPPRWREWPREALVQYLWYNHTRGELFKEIADRVELDRRDAGDDPRLRKEELCAVYLTLLIDRP